ncbi:MAG: BatA domain-containing protein [Candidatus Marinimicrobia bacterium]|nr:BatA domain-containing protein [Candidatus Neomarinimicrobiota bacterium]
MTFLWPGILILLVAAGIPLLIHLLSERRYEKVFFSSVRLLKQLETDSLRRIRLRQWLILLLRTLGIIFLILALAGPFVGGWRFGSPGEGVILLDTSPSSRFHPDFDRIARILQEEFPAWDTLWVQESTSEEELLQKVQRPEHILFLSDLQKNENMSNVLKNIQALMPKQGDDPILFQLNPFQNEAWVKSLYIPLQYFPIGEFIPVRATLAMPHERHSLAYLTVNGKWVAQTRANEDGDVEFSFFPETPGTYHGMVKIEGSNHPFNQRYFLLRAGEKITTLVIERENSYLKAALDALQYVDATYVSPERFPSVSLDKCDVFIVDGLPALPKAQMARIARFAENKPVWILMDRLPDATWQEIFPFQTIEEITMSEGQFRLTTLSEKNESMLSEFPPFSIARYFKVSPMAEESSLTPLITLSDGSPFLFYLSGTSLYVQTSPLSLEDNLMGIHPLFMKSLKHLLFYVTGRVYKPLTVGDILPIHQAGDEILRPDGRRVKVLEPYHQTDIPGIYTVISHNQQTSFAVNWPESETENTYFETPLPGFHIFPAQEDEIRSFRETLKGQSLTPLFFFLTALCWAGELFLITRLNKSRKLHTNV